MIQAKVDMWLTEETVSNERPCGLPPEGYYAYGPWEPIGYASVDYEEGGVVRRESYVLWRRPLTTTRMK